MNIAIALHRISEKLDFLDENIGNVVSFDSFKKLVNHFSKHSFVGLKYFLERYSHSENLLTLTFDDGNSSVYNLAYPFLFRMGIPFSVFANSYNALSGEPHWFEILEAGIRLSRVESLIYKGKKLPLKTPLNKLESLKRIKSLFKKGVIKKEDLKVVLDSVKVNYDFAVEWFKKKDSIIDPSRLEILATAGVEIGSHGKTHQILSRLSESEQEYEISQSKREIEEFIQKECIYFSYPNGWVTDYNKTTIELLKKCGYCGAFTANVSFSDSAVNSNSNRYELTRWCPSENSLMSLLES